MYSHIIQQIKSFFPNQAFIPLHEPRFTGNDKAYVMDAIDSTYVSSVGKYVDQFEAMMRDYTGAKYAIACVNGTAALHMSLILAGVKRDELVLTQAVSFIATCNAISYIGAEPVFIDIDKSSLGMSPVSLQLFLNENTRIENGQCIHIGTGKRIAACVPMHTFGHPIDIGTILEICNTYAVPLIEDAAESIGSKYKGQHTGTFGLLGAFSFNGNKTVTCGGGGVIVTNNEAIAKLGKHLTTQAKTPHRWEFNHDHIGYNYRLPNLNAALACAQMEQIDDFIKNKRALSSMYQQFFQGTDIEFVKEPIDTQSNYWLNAILLKDKAEQIKFLTESNDNGVMTRPIWTLTNKFPMFSHCIQDDLANSRDIENRLVNIPSSVRI
jgi:perosamine synthetase